LLTLELKAKFERYFNPPKLWTPIQMETVIEMEGGETKEGMTEGRKEVEMDPEGLTCL
jgi:hypothetical protein